MLDEVSMDSLKNTRAFVGWWGATETHLGTETANYENIDWSAAGQVGRPLTFSGATLGFQQILTGEADFSLGARDGKLHIQRKGPYQRIVQCASRSPVVLYDSCEKRAWLVPSSAVILHIARTRHYRNPYMNNEKKVMLPSADPSKSSHQAAEKVLLEQASFKLCVQDDLGSQDYYLRDLVMDIWSYLESLLDKNVTKEAASAPELRGTMRDILRGWEFMDLVDDKSPFRLKETYIEKSSGGWTDLARDIDAIVLFGSGFEDIIKPKEDSMRGLCHLWKSVPKGKDYLTASVPMMNLLYEQAGSKLSRKHLTSTHLQWHHGGQLWECCESTKPFSCNCNRLQQVVSESFAQLGRVMDPGSLEEKGAVIFGQSCDPLTSTMKDLLKPKVKQGSSLFSQPNRDLLSTQPVSSPDSNLSSDAGTASITSVSTLPTSDEDDQDPRNGGSIKGQSPSTFNFSDGNERSGRSRSLKRGFSGPDTAAQQPYRRQRKQHSEQIKENEMQCEEPLSPVLLNAPDGESVASSTKKTVGDGKNLSLRRRGNFTKQTESNDSILRVTKMAAIRNG